MLATATGASPSASCNWSCLPICHVPTVQLLTSARRGPGVRATFGLWIPAESERRPRGSVVARLASPPPSLTIGLWIATGLPRAPAAADAMRAARPTRRLSQRSRPQSVARPARGVVHRPAATAASIPLPRGHCCHRQVPATSLLGGCPVASPRTWPRGTALILRCVTTVPNSSSLGLHLDDAPAFVSKHVRLRKGELDAGCGRTILR